LDNIPWAIIQSRGWDNATLDNRPWDIIQSWGWDIIRNAHGALSKVGAIFFYLFWGSPNQFGA
jgi:hypothetical protein